MVPFRLPWILPAMVLAALQVPGLPGQEIWLQGYQRRLGGEVLPYPSADPEVGQALLVRSEEASRFIEWETEPVPADSEEGHLTFVWLFGLNARPEIHRFELAVEGRSWLAFENPAAPVLEPWTIVAENGARLTFFPSRVDRHQDLFGYAALEVPAGLVPGGHPLRLRVTGESAGSRIWYMTFQHAVAPEVRVRAPSALLRGEGGPKRPVWLSIVHLGRPARGILTTSLGGEQELDLALGLNTVELPCPENEATVTLEYHLRVEGRTVHQGTTPIEPLRKWRLDLVQHTHTDIGYTRPQTEILPDHLRFIDAALDCCDRTDDDPEEAKFRWTCESSWAVREFLKCRPPEQVARLRERVAEGRIEVTGMFLNMSEVMDEAGQAAFLRPLARLRDQGLRVTTAMQDDVHGVPWCLPDHLEGTGVRYLSMGPNGHRALIPFDCPTAFWWESPGGKRLLAYRADHYMTGNFWGLHTGRMELVEEAVFAYLGEMEAKGYPFDRLAVHYGGYPTDNSPPALAGCELIRRWNERYLWPRLRSALARDLFEALESGPGRELPVHRQAWPDWWTDGFGSAARETAAARRVQGELTAVEGVFALAALWNLPLPAGLQADLQAAREALIFYGEHTFGAAESITEPLGENNLVQWGQKSAYVWEAAKRCAALGEAALGLLPSRVPADDVPVLMVVNTLGWTRSGLVEIFLDHETLPPERPRCFRDAEGRKAPMVPWRHRPEGTTWAVWVEDVPALGLKCLRLDKSPEEPQTIQPVGDGASDVLENPFYRLILDPETGGVEELFDRDLGKNLVDPDAPWGFGQLIYETLSDRTQVEAFRLDEFSRRAPTGLRIGPRAQGPIWQSLTLKGSAPWSADPEALQVEIRLFHGEKRLEFHFRVRKPRTFDPEGIYVAFPFHLPGADLVYETLGGIAAPAGGLLPGSASDWQAVQGFAAAQSPEGQIVLSSPEIPLMHFGGLNLGRFHPQAEVEHPHLYSWVMNNYWTTNFQAGQEGEFRWSYRLTSAPHRSGLRASRFGWEGRIPLWGRVLPAGGRAPTTLPPSPLELDAPGLLLLSARPATNGDGVIFLFREVEGRPTTLRIRASSGIPPLKGIAPVSVLEEDLEETGAAVPFGPWQARFVRLRRE